MLTQTDLILGDSKMQPGIVEEHGHERVSLRHRIFAFFVLLWNDFDFQIQPNQIKCFYLFHIHFLTGLIYFFLSNFWLFTNNDLLMASSIQQCE